MRLRVSATSAGVSTTFVVSDRLRDNIKDAYILPEIMGSDHCPVGLDILW